MLLHITDLDLGDNQIDDVGVGSLAQVLGEFPLIQEFLHGTNTIGDSGTDRLSRVMGQCISLGQRTGREREDFIFVTWYTLCSFDSFVNDYEVI
jgi:hypothetical protein